MRRRRGADDDDEYAGGIDIDDDHGTRHDEQANVTRAVSTSQNRVRGLPDGPCSPQLTLTFRSIQPRHVIGTK